MHPSTEKNSDREIYSTCVTVEFNAVQFVPAEATGNGYVEKSEPCVFGTKSHRDHILASLEGRHHCALVTTREKRG